MTLIPAATRINAFLSIVAVIINVSVVFNIILQYTEQLVYTRLTIFNSFSIYYFNIAVITDLFNLIRKDIERGPIYIKLKLILIKLFPSFLSFLSSSI